MKIRFEILHGMAPYILYHVFSSYVISFDLCIHLKSPRFYVIPAPKSNKTEIRDSLSVDHFLLTTCTLFLIACGFVLVMNGSVTFR